MDYSTTAKEILGKIGGKENLISAAHCATRLRLVIGDNGKCDKEAIESLEGVKGVFFASGQMQVILGTGTVNKVYDEFIKIADIRESSKEEMKQAAASKANPFQRFIKTIGDIFVPIIPAIVASGFLMGIMEALNFMVNNQFLSLDTSGSLYVFAQLFSNTAYVFLPILIAFSAAKVFGGTPYLGAVIGMIMIHPDLQNAWTVASEGVKQTQEVFFGLYQIDMIGYQGHVIPIIIAVWVLCFIEKRLHKIVPAMLDLFVTPLVSVFATGYLALAAIGPVFVMLENGLLNGIQWLIALPLGIGSFFMGAAYATTVVSGIHHMYTLIDVGQLAQFGVTYWLPLASAANVAQGAATLAVAMKTRNKKLKSMALPSAFSAFMGITEPAIFGVNLRYMRPFIAGSIGGACGALYASMVKLGASGTGVTGIFGILLHLQSPMNAVHYLIAMGIAVSVAFALTWVFGWKEEDGARPEKKEAHEFPKAFVKSPLEGQVIPLAQVPDETFASGALGSGGAVIPVNGKVTAPFDGQVAMVFDTRHAIGLTGDNGVELLIHVGLNTVELEGKYYTVHVKDGDRIKTGDLLLEFDIEKIKEEGYQVTTPVIVTNSQDFKEITLSGEGMVTCTDNLLETES